MSTRTRSLRRNDVFQMSKPVSTIPHSSWSQEWNHTTSANQGELIPFCNIEILPGDLFSQKTKMFSRMVTPLFPVMGNAHIDWFWFFVPYRLVWSHWENFCGQNDETAWTPQTSYQIPSVSFEDIETFAITYGVNPLAVGGLADHLEVPPSDPTTWQTIDPNGYIDLLHFRAARKVWNDWFRNEALEDPVLLNTGDVGSAEELLPFGNVQCRGSVQLNFYANRFRDYFSSCLPAPQRGPAVALPFVSSSAPVVTGSNNKEAYGYDSNVPEMKFVVNDASVAGSGDPYAMYTTAYNGYMLADSADQSYPSASQIKWQPANLWADLSEVTSATVNALRQAFAIQRTYERQGLAGGRYISFLDAFFGVKSPDARLQRPEYLGGSRVRVQMDQVLQTSGATDQTNTLGLTGAYSRTYGQGFDFEKSFLEHGVLMGFFTIRVEHSYSQGLQRKFSRRDFFDFYLPTLAHIGEQPVLNKEIFLNYQATDDSNDDPFGYQEYAAEYRYFPSQITGVLRPELNNGFQAWSYGDRYQSKPVLSEAWAAESDENVAQTLAVNAPASQFIVDIRVTYLKISRPMPLHSTPGLIDHY